MCVIVVNQQEILRTSDRNIQKLQLSADLSKLTVDKVMMCLQLQDSGDLSLSLNALRINFVFRWLFLALKQFKIKKLGIFLDFSANLLHQNIIDQIPLVIALRILEKIEQNDIIKFKTFRFIHC